MISNQTMTNCIEEAKKISGMDFILVDSTGNQLVSTTSLISIDKQQVCDFINAGADIQEINDLLLLKIESDENMDYVLVVGGQGEKFLVGKLVAAQLNSLIIAYKDKVDKNSFFQNLLLDNLLLVDIYSKAQKLHIDASVPRCVFVIELSTIKDPYAIEMVKELVNTQAGDYVTTVDEDHIVVVKALNSDETYDDMEENARMLVDMFNSEALTNVRVAIGTIVNDIKGVSRSYKEANMALDVGKIFYAEKVVVTYSTLGIGRLIYQLPINLCEMFIDEVFGGDLSDEIDEEILNTINKFLDNNLNVSETSRQLYIHRNTLVYRIEKLQKATGMDVRNFDDALSFRIAMMVLGYINYVKSQS